MQNSTESFSTGEDIITNSTPTNIPPSTCDDYKSVLTFGLRSYEILTFITPKDDRIWTDRTDAWLGIFKAYIGVLGVVYFLLGLFSIVMIFKRDCIRIPTHTFFAVYMSIAVLGISRTLLLVLDPYGILGYIASDFPQWTVISRILASFGFPSLVAACTLIVFTLLKITDVTPGKQWYEYWKFVIPIVLIPYVISLAAEGIGHFAQYPALISVIVCDGFFVVWGVSVCVTFLFSGNRLLRNLRKRLRNTIRMSSTTEVNEHSNQQEERNDFAREEYQRHSQKWKRTARKITVISYGTAIMGLTYTLATTGTIVIVCVLIYKDCLGFLDRRGDSIIWLVLQFITRVSEILLSMFMLYSITDISVVIYFIKNLMTCKSCCCRKQRVMQSEKRPRAGTLTNMHEHSSSRLHMLPQYSRGDESPPTEISAEVERHLEEASLQRETLRDNEDIRTSENRNSHMNVATGTDDCQGDFDIELGNSNMAIPQSNAINTKGNSVSSIESSCVASNNTPEPAAKRPSVVGPRTSKVEVVNTTKTSSTGTECYLIDQLSPAPIQQDTQTDQNSLVQHTSTQRTIPQEATSRVSLDNVDNDNSKASTELDTTDRVTTEVACQTEPLPLQKPVPKPRRFGPKRPKQRQREIQQHLAKKHSNPFVRKQTV